VKVVMPMQSSIDPTPILGGEVSLDHVVPQPIQPLVAKVVMPMQSLDDPTLLLGSGVSIELCFYHLWFNIFRTRGHSAHSEHTPSKP
jgi:hypothetical protein